MDGIDEKLHTDSSSSQKYYDSVTFTYAKELTMNFGRVNPSVLPHYKPYTGASRIQSCLLNSPSLFSRGGRKGIAISLYKQMTNAARDE
jgi:hypothetical protein